MAIQSHHVLIQCVLHLLVLSPGNRGNNLLDFRGLMDAEYFLQFGISIHAPKTWFQFSKIKRHLVQWVKPREDLTNEKNTERAHHLKEDEPVLHFLAVVNSSEFSLLLKMVLQNSLCSETVCKGIPYRSIVAFIWPTEDKMPPPQILLDIAGNGNSICTASRCKLLLYPQVFLIFHNRYNPMELRAYEVYCIGNDLVISALSFDNVNDILSVEKRRSNLRGMSLKLVAQPDKALPIYAKFTEVNGKLQLTSGIMRRDIFTLSKLMNFKPEIVVGTGWVDLLPNGSLAGMGAQLDSMEADLIISPSEFVLYRAEKMSLGLVLHKFRVQAFFTKVKLIENSLLRPFQLTVWTAMGISFILVLTSLLLVARIKFTNKWVKGLTKEEEMIVQDAIWWILGATSLQGWSITPRCSSLRIIFLCGILSASILYICYASSIAAMFLASSEFFKTLDSLQHAGFKLYALNASSAGVAVLKMMAESQADLNDSSRAVGAAEGIHLIQTSRSVLLSGVNQLYQLSRRLPDHSDKIFCSLNSKVSVVGFNSNAGLLFRRRDHLRNLFRYTMLPWIERGLRDRQQREYERIAIPNCVEDPPDYKEVSLENVYGAFVVHIVGASLAGLSIFFESLRLRRISFII